MKVIKKCFPPLVIAIFLVGCESPEELARREEGWRNWAQSCLSTGRVVYGDRDRGAQCLTREEAQAAAYAERAAYEAAMERKSRFDTACIQSGGQPVGDSCYRPPAGPQPATNINLRVRPY